MAERFFSPDFYGGELEERSFQAVSDGFDSLPLIAKGELHESVTVSSGALSIPTGLGRPWVGYILCGWSGTVADNWEADLTNRESLNVEVTYWDSGSRHDSDGTAIIWVF